MAALKAKKIENAVPEFDDDGGGAVDIVFLLIIFFLVASSFSSEKKENVQLAERRQLLLEEGQPTSAPTMPPKAKSDIRFVIFEDATVKFDEKPAELEEPNSLEIYYMCQNFIDQRLEVFRNDPEILKNPETGEMKINVQVWTDRKAQSGIVMQCIQCILDKDLKPQLLFLNEMEPKGYAVTPIPPALPPGAEGVEGAAAPAEAASE